MAGLLDLMAPDPNIVSRGSFYPYGYDKTGRGQMTYPGLLIDAAKSFDNLGTAMRLPANAPVTHPAYKSVFDAAGTISLPSLLSPARPSSTVGMNLYHGGPNKWEAEPGFPQGRPRLDKIGSGEGNQAYGHGFYSAEKPEVATSYKTRLSPISSKDINKALPQKNQGSLDNANRIVSDLLDKLDSGEIKRASEYLDIYEVRPELMEAYKIAIKQIDEGGNLYKIDIPDEDIAKYIDLDAPLSEQSQHIKNALEKIKDQLPENAFDDLGGNWDAMFGPNVTGEQLMGTIDSIMGGDFAAEVFRKAGIPGNRYSDGLSSRFASDIDKLIKKHGSREAALDHAKSSLADAKKMLKNNSSIPTDMGQKLVNRWAEEIKLLNTPSQTRNYVTWDQDVLDRVKVLQRNKNKYQQEINSGVPFI